MTAGADPPASENLPMNITRHVESIAAREDVSSDNPREAGIDERRSGDPGAEDVTLEWDEPVPGIVPLVELILKGRSRLEKLVRDPSLQPELVPRFLAVALAGFTLYGVAMSLVLDTGGTWPELASVRDVLGGSSASGSPALLIFSNRPATGTLGTPAGCLILAYNLGLVAAIGGCLPSLYFFGLLSCVKMSMLDVVVHALKAHAISAIALVGILPVYAAVAMGVRIFGLTGGFVEHSMLWLGLVLPFIAGLWGTRSLYVGFSGMADTLPPDRRARRACFLSRLVIAWSAVYTVVTPVMIFTLWEAMQG